MGWERAPRAVTMLGGIGRRACGLGDSPTRYRAGGTVEWAGRGDPDVSGAAAGAAASEREFPYELTLRGAKVVTVRNDRAWASLWASRLTPVSPTTANC